MWLKRTPWAALLISVLLLGALDWHPAGDLHDATASGPGEIYFPGAEHPDQPAHFEQADPAYHPHCQACIYRMQTSGAHLRPTAALAPLVPQTREAVEPAPLRPSIALRSRGARAPPVLS